MKIFISHSSQEKWIARKISKDLEALGFETFLDEKDIRTGQSINRAIRDQLRDCDEVLLLLSPHSRGSHWVFMEIGGANALRKPIATILINLGANDVPPPLNEALVRDLNDIERYYDELKQRLAGGVPPSRPRRPTARVGSARRATSLAIGSHVVIKDPNLLTDPVKQQNPRWVPEMDMFAGKTTLIDGVKNGLYRLQIDSGDFLWHGDWLQSTAT